MNFKKWVKSIQTAGYNGARTKVFPGYSITTQESGARLREPGKTLAVTLKWLLP